MDLEIKMRPLSPEQIKKGRAAAARLAANYYQGLQASALERWWRREIAGRYLGEC